MQRIDWVRWVIARWARRPVPFLVERPALLLGAPLLLASLALLACYLPARGPLRIDPAVALREEWQLRAWVIRKV